MTETLLLFTKFGVLSIGITRIGFQRSLSYTMPPLHLPYFRNKWYVAPYKAYFPFFYLKIPAYLSNQLLTYGFILAAAVNT